MKRISRAQLRGKSLDPLCKKAHGLKDKPVFCYGILDGLTDEPLKDCRVCKAFVRNEEPPKVET